MTQALTQTLSSQFEAKTETRTYHGWEGDRYTGKLKSTDGTIYSFSVVTDIDFLKYMRSFTNRLKHAYMDDASGIHQLRVSTNGAGEDKGRDMLCFFDGGWLVGKKPETAEHHAIIETLISAFPRPAPRPTIAAAPKL
ncbi:MAG TPA: hypothetical protein PKX38_01415 [Alphaproteobacteria bacterium]|nr:hypothetical protein [Micavibrio sp.]MBK9562756.1 hypothetical protein [Micavibrio sp.]HQX26576.1 hypothetical protein [Alphaproteobacteria bacterium]